MGNNNQTGKDEAWRELINWAKDSLTVDVLKGCVIILAIAATLKACEALR